MSAVNEACIAYRYRHAPVPGGGFVTGFLFHPKEKNILYARTDIGGVYRYDFEHKKWHSLMDHVTTVGKWESYPLSIALDDNNPNRLYIIAGAQENSYLCRSEDRGETFSYFPLPSLVHGNAPGRGTGERLIVDCCDSHVIYLGTQQKGLFVSEDRGETWRSIAVQANGCQNEQNIAFVWLDPRSRGEDNRLKTIVVSTSGQNNADSNGVRGKSLHISFDGGKSFNALPNQPAPPTDGTHPGFVGQRAAFTNGALYVTMASVLYSWRGFDGYACDMGGQQKGCIMRFEIDNDAKQIIASNITPDFFISDIECGTTNFGFGGICADPSNPGTMICTTQCSPSDSVLMSNDYGKNWRIILQGLSIGKMDFTVSYMKPEYNGGENLIHWLSDIKIDPFNSNRAVFNTGTGIFMTENLQDDTVIWAPCCDGLEETVHLNVYSPPKGNKFLIDIIGDLGGFAFSDLTKPAENSFADENGNRYITCLNADFTDENPQLVVVTARGNWKGKTTGGLILSNDQCDTWQRLNDPMGISEKIDELITAIRKPNTNSGWTALSADGEAIVWCVANGNILPSDCVVVTYDKGSSWTRSVVYNKEHKEVTGLTLKVITDRITPNLFYGFGDDSVFYVSCDKGRSFNEIYVPEDFPKLLLGGIDGRMPAEIRAEPGKNIVWIATGYGGLWKIDYSVNPEKPVFKRVTKEGDSVFRQAMGKEKHDSEYNTLYINGILDGVYGFWRSVDEGKSFTRINNDKQMFGDIRSIAGDPRVFGRFYIGTGSRGVLWGEPVSE